MKKIVLFFLCVVLCLLNVGCGRIKSREQEKNVTEKVKDEDTSLQKKVKKILAQGKVDAETIGYDEFMSAYTGVTMIDRPSELFISREAMETFFYNASLVENAQYSNIESGMIALGYSKEKAREYYQILVDITVKCRKFTEEVYLGKTIYMTDDEKFLNKYNKIIAEAKEIGTKLLYGEEYKESSKTLKLGETERGAYVVSTYSRLDSLKTSMKWKQIDEFLPDGANTPKLNDPTMVFGDYYEECKEIVGGGEERASEYGFSILSGLGVAYSVNADNTVAMGSVSMSLDLGSFASDELQDMYYYFSSAEEMANYYMDAMVKCMQVFYKNFGITDDMRESLVGRIESALMLNVNTENACWVSQNNEFEIIVDSHGIFFDSL